MASPAVPIHRFTVDDVLAMSASGILGEYDRVELVDGLLIDLSPQDPLHEDAKEWLDRFFHRDANLATRVECMFLTSDGYLVPDLQVAREFKRGEHPRTAPLVIEVANTSLARDHEKAADYARAGVAEYWIVDVVAKTVIVHCHPSGDAYATVTKHDDGEFQPPLGAPPLALDALFASA
ncbi:MAG: Uma2 family endonuclease [Solirubrobacteraceae bacterium]